MFKYFAHRALLTTSRVGAGHHPTATATLLATSTLLLQPPHQKTYFSSNGRDPVSRTRKPGVSEPQELQSFVAAAQDKLVVVDVRGSDEAVEGGPLPHNGARPQALNLVWDRAAATMPLPPDTVAKDTPIITHCGGGGRGQKAREFLQKNGYTNVLNGGGPEDAECWKEFGDK